MTWAANWVLLSLEDTLLVIAEALIAVLTATVWKCESDRYFLKLICKVAYLLYV